MSQEMLLAGRDGRVSGDGVNQPSEPTINPRDTDNVDVDRIINAIKRREAPNPQPNSVFVDSSKPWRRQYRGDFRSLPRWILPGFGEREPDCGKPYALLCSQGHVHETTRTPGGSTCPFCAAVWARDRAIDAVARLEAYKRYTWSSGSADEMYLHHMVVSPGSDFTVEADSAKEAFERTWETVKTALEELGAIAGFGAFHPWSGDHSDDLEDDRGSWKDRLFEERDWLDDVHDELEFRPHFHVVVISPFMHGGEATKRIESETGWIVERITDEETGKSIDGLHDLARVTAYTLSHTGLYKTDAGQIRSATRYFGIDDSQFRKPSPHIEEAAEKAVHDVAPEVLGLPRKEQHCHTDLSGDGLDLSLDIGDGSTSGSPAMGSSSGGFGSTSTAGELPAAHRGELPIAAPRDRGELQDAGEAWSTPVPTEGRLEALREARPEELIATYEEITKENVWAIKNSLEETEVQEDLCGEPLRPAHEIIRRLDEDPEQRRNAEALDELREEVVGLLDESARDVDALEGVADRFRGEEFDDLRELQEDVEELVQKLGRIDELQDLVSDLQALLNTRSAFDVDELQEEIVNRVDNRLEDLDELPSHLRPIRYVIQEAGNWIKWEGPGGG